MLSDYLPIVIMLAAALVFVVGNLVVENLFGPRGYTKVKGDVYESGMPPISKARVRLPIKFYMTAVLFILFDIEVVFLYPWAVVYRRLLSQGSFILIEMLVFIAVLFIGYYYLWRKGAFEWD